MVAEKISCLGVVEREGVVRGRRNRELRRGILAIGDENFAWLQAGELIAQRGGLRDFGQLEFAGAEVEPGESVGFFPGQDGSEVVVAVFLESEIVKGAGAENARDLAADEFAGCDFADLVANGDAFAGLDEFGHVGAGAVVGDAAHGDVVAFGQCDVEDGGRFARVVEKHFVKIAEPEKQESVRGKLAPDLLVLAHHGGELRGGHAGERLACGDGNENRRGNGGHRGRGARSGGRSWTWSEGFGRLRGCGNKVSARQGG